MPESRLIQSPRILYTQVVRKENGGLLTFQRIEPPVVPVKAAVPVAALAPTRAVRVEPMRSLMLGAGVFEGSLTEVSWMHEGRACRAWSAVDFRLLQGVGGFELGGAEWSLFAMITVQRKGATPGEGQAWPEFSPEMRASVPLGMRAWYALVEFAGSAEEEAAACAGMDALHEYVETHWAELEQQRAAREAKAAADAAWKAAHPPPPPSKDTIIQFWPVKSAAHLPETGAAPEAAATTTNAQEVQP
jgi:hypothetical protein